MPQKTVKKMPAKNAAAKKTNTKKMVVNSAVESHAECSHSCKCGCHGGCRICHFMGKLIIVIIIFMLGWGSSCLFHKGHDMKMPPVQFDENGCLVMDSVKCPMMLEKLSQADIDGNGCITKQEFKNVKKHFGDHGKMMHKMPRDDRMMGEQGIMPPRPVVEPQPNAMMEK